MEWIQSSYQTRTENQSFMNHSQEMGQLFLVPTPIGNLEDITFRALETLKNVDYIACEDTRHSRKLLNHFSIDKKLVSIHEHDQKQKGPVMIQDIKQGKHVAYMTDAGMPAISDPGYHLVQYALEEKIDVISLPGANAGLTALIASGLPTDHFLFYGFLNRKKKEKKEALEKLQYIPYTLIFYEAPHRLKETLQAILDVFGSRQAALIREISKKHETYVRGDIERLQRYCEEGVKGECCIIIHGYDHDTTFQQVMEESMSPNWWNDLSVADHVKRYIQDGYISKEAIKMTAKDRGISKRDVYKQFHTMGE